MLAGYDTKNFVSEEQQTIFHKKCDNGIQFFVKTIFSHTDFLSNQQEILNDFIGNILSVCNVNESLPEEIVKQSFEKELQTINQDLETFATKIGSEKFFGIKGVAWIIYQGVFMASMIGDVSLFIVRNDKIHYKLGNDKRSNTKISIFSDFVEGELDLDDQIIVLGTNYKDVFHDNDIKELNTVIGSTELGVLSFLEELLLTRIEKQKLGFIILYDYHKAVDTVQKLHQEKINYKKYNTLYKNFQHFLFKNKFSVSVAVLGIVVFILGYNMINDMFANNSDIPQIDTESGTKIISIQDIRKDIDYFTKLDASSYEKGKVYKNIVEQLDFLENRGKRLEDVKKLKKIVKNKYYEGFNVIYMNDIAQNIDITPSYTFTSQEQSTLGTVKTLLYSDSFAVGGTKGALIGGVNADIKGSLVDYNIDATVQACSFDLSRKGLYCFTDANTIVRATKAGSNMLTLTKPVVDTDTSEAQPSLNISFDNPIMDIGIFNKNSLYVLHKDPTMNAVGKYITKYVNVLGKFDEFKQGIAYVLNDYNKTGQETLDLNDFTIDGTFLTRDAKSKSIYQLRRDNSVSTINYREVSLNGGDTVEDQYDANTKILSDLNSKYVYLFDRTNQTFTVYKSNPYKTNDRFTYSYALTYVCRFKFDFESGEVVDAITSTKNGTNPYLYLLRKDGIYQISLGEFIKKYDIIK